jgi:hypothetical protein
VLRRALLSGVVLRGWRRVVVLDRAATRCGLQVEMQQPVLGDTTGIGEVRH